MQLITIVLCSYGASAQDAMRPWIFLGPNAFKYIPYHSWKPHAEKIYILDENIDLDASITFENCLQSFAKDIIEAKTSSPFRYIIVNAHGKENATVNIGKEVHRALLPDVLFQYVPSDRRKSLFCFIEVVSCHAGIDIDEDNLEIQLQSLPANTIMMLHTGKRALPVSIGNESISNGLLAGNHSAFERFIQQVYCSANTFKVVYKRDDQKVVYFKKKHLKGDKPITAERVKQHCEEEIERASRWWQDEVRPYFKDNIILSENDCNAIAAKARESLIKEHIQKLLKDQFIIEIRKYKLPVEIDKYELPVINNIIENNPGLLSFNDYSLISELTKNIIMNGSDIEIVRKIWKDGFTEIFDKDMIGEAILTTILYSWPDHKVPGKKESTEQFINELVYSVGISEEHISPAAGNKEVLAIMIKHPAFLKKKWNYNQLMDMLPDPLQKKNFIHVVAEYIRELEESSITGDNLFNTLFDEKFLVKVAYANSFASYKWPEPLIKGAIGRHLLKCGFMIDDEKQTALKTAIACGAYDKEYNKVVAKLVEKYIAGNRVFPGDDNGLCLLSVAHNNMEALAICLKARGLFNKSFYKADVLNALKFVIEKDNTEAAEMIIDSLSLANETISRNMKITLLLLARHNPGALTTRIGMLKSD